MSTSDTVWTNVVHVKRKMDLCSIKQAGRLAVGVDAELTQDAGIIDPVERAVTRCVQRGVKGRRWGSENQRRGSIWHRRQHCRPIIPFF